MISVHLICNAHLDPVWQWRWEEGASEALATFRNAVDILDEHPSLIFCHNEAFLYQWVERLGPLRRHPALRRGRALGHFGRLVHPARRQSARDRIAHPVDRRGPPLLPREIRRRPARRL